MAQEDKLSAVLSEFARTLATDFPIQRILDHLVERIVEVLPVTAAGVTLISAGRTPRYIAASDASALRYEKLQTEVRQGPCLTAYDTGEAVVGSRPLRRRSVPAVRPAGARSRARGRVHVPAAPRQRPTRRAGPLPRHARRPGPP